MGISEVASRGRYEDRILNRQNLFYNTTSELSHDVVICCFIFSCVGVADDKRKITRMRKERLHKVMLFADFIITEEQ